MKHRLLIGAHMSIAGSIDQSIDRGETIGCSTMQIFLKSNRQWTAPALSNEEIDRFHAKAAVSLVNPIVAHTSYLINLGSTNKLIAEKSLQSFIEELHRAEQLHIPYLVVHPGAAVDATEKEAISMVIMNLNTVLHETTGSTTILLETMAGQGSTIGNTFEQLATIIEAVDDQMRIGICFDTCHVWAAGYNFRTPTDYNVMWHNFDTIIGLDKLHVIHVNDSKAACNSHIDRHEDIGKGKLGLEPFGLLMNDERFFDIPKILETPKETVTDDIRNMDVLINLITPATQRNFMGKKDIK